MYGLAVLADDIADHPGNQTRFVLVARTGVPARTGHDRTGLVIYQRADEPGSLISILQEFAARRINLSNLLSRPTKDGGLGDYCFIIYADGHIADELLADAVRSLHAKQGKVKFLGSYPAAGEHAHTAREHADARWREADDWVESLRRQIALTHDPSVSGPRGAYPSVSRHHGWDADTRSREPRTARVASNPERWQSGQMHPP